MTQNTLYWHDYETFGVDPARDRPVQFAGIHTDEDLNIIGEPLNIMARPTPDTLPHPMSSLITGITPQQALEQGIPEAEFIARILMKLSQPGTCGVGYNSLRFDDEVTRNTLYRNLHDPYGREWQNGNSRWDLIDLVRTANALRGARSVVGELDAIFTDSPPRAGRLRGDGDSQSIAAGRQLEGVQMAADPVPAPRQPGGRDSRRAHVAGVKDGAIRQRQDLDAGVRFEHDGRRLLQVHGNPGRLGASECEVDKLRHRDMIPSPGNDIIHRKGPSRSGSAACMPWRPISGAVRPRRRPRPGDPDPPAGHRRRFGPRRGRT